MGALLRREVPSPWDDPQFIAGLVWLCRPWYQRLLLRALGRRP